MSIIAGVFCRNAEDQVPPELRLEVIRALSRNSADQAEVYEGGRCILAKVDVSAYDDPAFYRGAAGSAAVLAGNPVCEGLPVESSRGDQFRQLAQGWDAGDWSGVQAAQGTFCAAHYDPGTATLALVTDKTGVRGLYFWCDSRLVVFASALRVLEAITRVPKRVDLRSAAEVMAFGFPLADRTPYADIVRLRAGELATFSEHRLSRCRYWKWEQVSTASAAIPELAERTYGQFMGALKARIRHDTGVLSFLSGGLDSRCVVSGLSMLGRRVWTCNFSLSRTLDQELARGYAEACGAVHTEKTTRVPEHVVASLARMIDSGERPTFPIERPRCAWSGDGGSVALGHVYMNDRTVDFLKAGRRSDAVASFMADIGARVPRSLLRRELRKKLPALPGEGIEQELAGICCEDAVRQFHIFLLNNDQRWHISWVYENIDLHRIELELPFFDGGFLAAVLSVPAEQCLRHKFYHEWLSLFPESARQVPWQTYPGHEPCPLPLPSSASDQWSDAVAAQTGKVRKAGLLDEAQALFADFPVPIFDENRFRAALLLYRAGIRDYSYAIAAASVFYRSWAAARGQFVALRDL